MRTPGAPLIVWLLLALVGAARGEIPVLGDPDHVVNGAEVADMLALARFYVAPGTEPAFVEAWSSNGESDKPVRADKAVIYFQPSEQDAQHCRGQCLTVYSPRYRWPKDDPPDRWRQIGGWMAESKARAEEYLIVPRRGEELAPDAASDLSKLGRIPLHSDLPSGEILDLVDTVRGFSPVQKDGSALSLAALPIGSVGTTTHERVTTANVVVLVPGISPFYYLRLRREKGGWRIASASLTMCMGY